MINNMHIIDRIIRIIIALVIIYFYFWGPLTGLAAVILMIIAAVFLVTGISGYCPVYQLLKISTKGK